MSFVAEDPVPGEQPPPASGWERSPGRKLAVLWGSRAVTQVLALGWFLIAARELGADEFGIMASGLAGFAFFTILADLGTTWSLPRYVAAQPSLAWRTYCRANRIRATGLLVVSVPVVLGCWVFVDPALAFALTLGALIALASGASEIGYATLRSTGRVRMEGVLLPAERVAFIAIGWGAIAAGAGAYGVLAIYIVTNAATAVVLARALWRGRPTRPVAFERFWDREARRTGIAFTMLALGPRLNALLLVLLGSASAVATYAVASRPVEQLALVIIGFSTSLLPLMRSLEVGGKAVAADGVAALAAEAVTVALIAPISWMAVAPAQLVELLYGDQYADAATVLGISSVVAATWALRGIVALRLISAEHATEFVRVGAVGLGLGAILGVALIPSHGPVGAAVALAITEVVSLVLLVVHTPHVFGMSASRGLARVLAVGVLCAVGAWCLRDGPLLLALVNVALWTGLGSMLALRSLRRIDGVTTGGA